MAKFYNSTPGLPFERNFNAVRAQEWMQDHWKDSFLYSGVYLVLIFGVKLYMKSRTRFVLQKELFLWNLLLATFSILGAARFIPETMRMIGAHGFHSSVCMPSDVHSNVWQFWFFALVLSKVLELGDTVFIVLRKAPLIFLHWYHHITVLMYCWYSYSLNASTFRWFLGMNYFVHSIMYAYFALRARNVKVAKPIAACITSLQILQMAVGMIVNIYALRMKQEGAECDTPVENIVISLAMYSSYFALFVKFFSASYLRQDKKKLLKNE